MSTQQISLIHELEAPAEALSPRLTRHDVVFQFRLVSFKGEPLNDDSPYHRVLMDTDHKLEKTLSRAVTGWTFRDPDGIEGPRLELYEPEFGVDEDLPEDVQVYDVSVFSGRELSTSRAEATDERPISVQQLVEEAVPAIAKLYGDVGVQMELHRVLFRKQYESATAGYYRIE